MVTGEAMKIQFPLWLVTEPDAASTLVDVRTEIRKIGDLETIAVARHIRGGRGLEEDSAALYTDEAEATAAAQARLDARDGAVVSTRTITLRVAGSDSAAAICQSFLADEIRKGNVSVTSDPGTWPSMIRVHPLTREETLALTGLLTKQSIYWHHEREINV